MCIVYCLCLATSGIVFNPRAGSITDHSQSAKDIDPYLKSQLYVEDPSRRQYSFYQMGWVNPGSERTTEIIAVGGIWTHNL